MQKITTKSKIRRMISSKAQLAEKVGTTSSYANRIIKGGDVINNTFVQMMDRLGYDIELTYVKKDTNRKA